MGWVRTLPEFLIENKSKILSLTEEKALELAGDHPSSEKLKEGLPIFIGQVIDVIRRTSPPSDPPPKDVNAIALAADRGDEPAMARAAGHPEEAELAKSAGNHGAELFRLGYTLSHVVHAYGAMCQAITEVATARDFTFSAKEFHALNRCLDVAIAGAVTTYQAHQDSLVDTQENEQAVVVGSEMRNAVMAAKTAFQAIKQGTVGLSGSTGQVLDRSLRQLEELIDQPVPIVRRVPRPV